MGSSDAVHSILPHVHALMLLTPNYLEKFHAGISEARLRSWIGSIKELQIEKFSKDKGTLKIWFHIARKVTPDVFASILSETTCGPFSQIINLKIFRINSAKG